MRLGENGFLEEETDESPSKTGAGPVTRPETVKYQAHGKSEPVHVEVHDTDTLPKLRQQAELPDDASQTVTQHERGKPVPGAPAWDYSVEQRTGLLRLVRRRVWALSAAFGALIVLFIGTTALLRNDRVSWSTVAFVAVPFVVAATVLMLVFVFLLRAKSRFDKQVEYWFNPAAQDQMLARSLQFGDPRGDGVTGSYVTRNSLAKTIHDRDGEPHKGERFLPLECQGRAMRGLVIEISIRRWWDLGLLEASPVVDREELRLVFGGTAIQYPRPTDTK